jgi:hypothetical protein
MHPTQASPYCQCALPGAVVSRKSPTRQIPPSAPWPAPSRTAEGASERAYLAGGRRSVSTLALGGQWPTWVARPPWGLPRWRLASPSAPSRIDRWRNRCPANARRRRRGGELPRVGTPPSVRLLRCARRWRRSSAIHPASTVRTNTATIRPARMPATKSFTDVPWSSYASGGAPGASTSRSSPIQSSRSARSNSCSLPSEMTASWRPSASVFLLSVSVLGVCTPRR